jgi:hypothetical protein
MQALDKINGQLTAVLPISKALLESLDGAPVNWQSLGVDISEHGLARLPTDSSPSKTYEASHRGPSATLPTMSDGSRQGSHFPPPLSVRS